MPSTVDIRTEASLADRWWRSADGAKPEDVRAAQRLLAELAETALASGDTIDAATDLSARDYLLRSLTLSEPKRDRLGFYHDVLRDWAIGARLHEDIALLDGVNLMVPPLSHVARGIEFAGRFALEKQRLSWQALLAAGVPPRMMHGGARRSWRSCDRRFPLNCSIAAARSCSPKAARCWSSSAPRLPRWKQLRQQSYLHRRQ